MEQVAVTTDRRERVEGLLRECGSVLVAFSGGVDSALLAAVAARVLGERAAAATAVSPSLAPGELDDARAVAAAVGIRHIEVATEEVADPAYAANTLERCFHCKDTAYGVFTGLAQREGLAVVVDGTNADDKGDYRPGRRAAGEHGVRSPLVEAGMGKQEVREWAKELGLSVWDKPAAACLSSRIPYGTEVTPERLRMVGEAEAAVKRLGFAQCRVRYHGDVARLEIEPGQIGEVLDRRQEISAAVKAAGFLYVSLDLDGFRSGSMNEGDREANDMSEKHSCIDFDRFERQGFPEVVYCEGKTSGQIIDNLRVLAAAHGRALGTRLCEEKAADVLEVLDGAVYDSLSRAVVVGELPQPGEGAPSVAVVCAGTSDLPVAGEAEATLRFLGHPVQGVRDVGVAGLHRLDGRVEELREAAVVIVVAGMEGALPSVVGGLVAAPVIAVPTSVGYGASFQGVAALLGMLNSCAAGLTVTNIDNGFGAAMAAHRILAR